MTLDFEAILNPVMFRVFEMRELKHTTSQISEATGMTKKYVATTSSDIRRRLKENGFDVKQLQWKMEMTRSDKSSFQICVGCDLVLERCPVGYVGNVCNWCRGKA